MNKSIFKSIVFTILFSLSGNLYSQFIENKGQILDKNENFVSDVNFYYELENTALYFHNNKIVYSFIELDPIDEKMYADNRQLLDSLKRSRGATQYRMDMEFVGSNENIEIIKGEKIAGDIHFYLNKRNGIRDVGSYESITYKNIYDNIDVIFYQNSKGLKYDFILHEGANIDDIKINYNGATDVSLVEGKVIIETLYKTLEEEIPLSYIDGDSKNEIDVFYNIDENNILSFSTNAKSFNTLTIDPVLEWATYFNNTTPTTSSLDYANSHLDANGNYYIYGQAYSAANSYPVISPGGSAYTAVYNSNADLYIAKFGANRALVWSTYFGGSNADNSYGSNVMTTFGNTLHIVGERVSQDAPFVNGGGFYVAPPSNNHALWARFNITTGALEHLTGIGGIRKPSIEISSGGNVGIIGHAYSFDNPYVVNRAGAFNQPTNGGSTDMFFMLFNSSFVQSWGTFLGGPAPQESFMFRFDNSNNIVFIGESSWFGASTPATERLVQRPGAYYQSAGAGGVDVLLGMFNASGSLIWNTLYGGDNSDARWAQQGGYAKLLIDPTTQEILMFWNTTSTNLPVLNGGGGAYYKTVPTHASFDGSGSFWNYAAYFAKFNTAGALSHASYWYNSTNGDLIHDVTFGGCNKLYIAGRTDFASATTIPLAGGFNLATGGQVIAMQMNRSTLNAEWSSSLSNNPGYGPSVAGRTDNPRVYFASEGYDNVGPTVDPGGGAYYQSSNVNGTSANFMIWQLHPTLPPDVTGTTTICQGQTTTLTASNGAGAPYNWYTTATGGTSFFTGAVYTTPALVSNTTYYVSSGTGLCASPRTQVDITVNPGPAAPTISSNSPVCVGGTLNLTSNTIAGATYSWTGPSSFSSSAEDPTRSPVTLAMAGTYSCTVTVAGCTSSAASTNVVVNTLSVAPTGITGTSTICSGNSTTLTVSGGTLGTGATVEWFTGSCGGTPAGTGNSITVSPTSNTTYFVRYSGTCNTTTCASQLVTVNTNSTIPTGITGTSTICSGNSTTLTVSGGTLGTGATVEWFTGSCGGTSVGTGNSITVSPTSNTTYFVRYSGPCNTTTCVSQLVTVNTSSIAPTGITGTTTICAGNSTTLTVSGGTLGTGGVVQWYTGSCGGTLVSTGNSITVSPLSNTTYYVRYSGTCNTTTCVSTTVTLNTNSTTPTGITGTSTICSGNSTTLTVAGGTLGTGASVEWFTGSCGGTPAGTGNSITVSPTSNTTYFVRYTGPCNTTTCTSQLVTVNTNSTAPTGISGTTTICSGNSTTLTLVGGTAGTGATAEWFTGSCGGTPAGTGNSITVSPTSNTTYFVRYSGTCNTTTCASQVVTVNTNSIAPTSITGTSTICSGNSTTLTLVGGTLGTGASVEWFTGSCGGTPAGTGNSITVSPTSSTTYYVRYTGTCNTTSCASQLVTINPIDDATFSYSGGTFCLTGTDPSPTISGTTGGTFTINNGGVIDATTGEIDLVGSGVDSYIVTYTTAGTCPDSETFAVQITSAPDATFSYTGTPYCEGSGNASVTFVPGASGGVFSSTAGLVINSGTGEIDLNTSTAGIYTVENNIAASGGCAAANATTSIEIIAQDDASFSYTGTTFCLSGVNPVATLSGTTGGTFTINNGGVIDATTGEVDLVASGIDAYTITYTTSGPCLDIETFDIQITSAPDATFSYTGTPYCEGSGNASVTFVPGASGGVFSSTVGLVINSGTGEINLNTSSPGIYTVENNIAASGGCAAANATTSIEIIAQDDASFSYASATFCENETNPIASISGTAGGAFTSSPAGLSIDATSGEIDLSSSTMGNTYTVTYTTTGTCPDDQDFTITLNESPITPTVTSDATGNTICEGESVEIDASGSGMGIIYNVYDAVTGGNLVGTTPLTVSPTVDTDYFVEAVNSNSCGNLGGLQTISITVNPLPSVDAGNDETICPGDNVTLTATGTGSVIWSTSETSASITVAPSSDAIYTVTLTDANNCSNSDDVTVSVVNIGSSLVAVDDNYTVTTEVSTNFDVTSNDTYSGTSISIIDNPTSGTASENIDGTIDYISNAGFVGTDVLTYAICDVFCVNICDTATVTITVNREDDFSVPGGFSPNGDNINDIFVINGLDAYPNNNLTIFNRWGSMVFEANPYNNDWDGAPNVGGVLTGDKVTTGTYFYILDLGNDTEPLRGSIEVKRD